MLRNYSQICTQELVLVVLEGPEWVLGIDPYLAACKANILYIVLSLWSLLCVVKA